MWLGMAGSDKARQGLQGGAWQGNVRYGVAWQIEARTTRRG